MGLKTNVYEMTVTDTFGGEPNFCWARKYNVHATSLRGAIIILNKEEGFRALRYMGCDRWDVRNACICILADEKEPDYADTSLRSLPHKPVYETYAGNVGKIYSGYNCAEARKAYSAALHQLGRCDGTAYILKDGEPTIWTTPR